MSIEPASSPRVGIIGSGQLGRMLYEAAVERVGVQARVYGLEPGSPASDVGALGVRGSLEDTSAVLEFVHGCDVVLIESEFIPASVLRAVQDSSESSKWVPAIPSLLTVQSKLEQKRLWSALQVPTSEWKLWQPVSPILAAQELQQALSSGEWVAKAARNGYDGRGTLIGDRPLEEISLFLDRHPGSEIYFERKVDYRRELAIVGCRDRQKKIHSFPVVESRQYRGVCERVLSLEACERARLQPQAEAIFRRVAEGLDWTGVLAIEFFETPQGELLVNEIAPRVHNTGHFTLEASRKSQFEVQVRAALGLPLESSDFQSAPAFAMLNLLGPERASGVIPRIELELAGLAAKDYGKRQSRPLRKLGHWNWVSSVAKPRSEMDSALDGMSASWKEWVRSRIRAEGASS